MKLKNTIKYAGLALLILSAIDKEANGQTSSYQENDTISNYQGIMKYDNNNNNTYQRTYNLPIKDYKAPKVVYSNFSLKLEEEIKSLDY